MLESQRVAASNQRSLYSHHIESLDGLRGLAVLGVMASHLFPGNVKGPLLVSLGTVLTFGATGVDLFFVLSGFLITGILIDALGDRSYFRNFYARRLLRIFPLYYGVLLTFIVLTPWLGIRWHGMNWVLLLYLQNTNIAGPFYAFGVRGLDHFWSLAVEEQFYFVWPFVVFFIRDLKKLLWVCGALSCTALLIRLVLAFHHTIYHIINRSTPTRMDSLLVGAALALLLRSRFHDIALDWARVAFFAVAGLMVALNLTRFVLTGPPGALFIFDACYLSLRYTLLAIVYAAVLAWCLKPGSVPRRLFEARILRSFGKYSYGLYVLHFVILSFLLRTFKIWIAHFTLSKPIAVVGAGSLCLLLSVVAAYASYHLYEKPFLRLKKYFQYDSSRSEDQSLVTANS